MINRIGGSNQVATPTDQMGTPPDIGKSKMATPPEPIKTYEQTQSDAGIAQSLQQSALQKAGDQRVQASLLQTELLTKLREQSVDGERKDPLMKETLLDPLHEGKLIAPSDPTTAKTNLPPPDSGIDIGNKL